MDNTFASFSFGCRVNRAEKEALDRQLSAIGYQYSDNQPAIYIINTCAVTQKAEREARQLIYQTKRKWPQTKIIVTGCAATKWINDRIRIPEVDRLIDNTNKEYIARLLDEKLKINNEESFLKHSKIFADRIRNRVSNNSTSIEESILVPLIRDGTVAESAYIVGKKILSAKKAHDKYLSSRRLLLKIQDGCQRFCTFCIVPYLRGLPKSVPIAKIIKIIKEESRIIKEVILTAINTQAYGYDTGESFIDLIQAILTQTNIARLSFGSIHPWSINDNFFTFYKKVLPQKRLVDYFHIPLQSGSNKILQLMKRGYTREEFEEKLKTIETINPFAFIGTDIIVGFLEEEELDFADTFNFLADSPISKFHIFRFSVREKTAAYFMKKKLKEPTFSEKIKRAKILAELSIQKYQKFLQKHIGKTFSALVLDKQTNTYQEALLQNQIIVFIKINKNITGEIKRVRIERIKEDKLMGKIV